MAYDIGTARGVIEMEYNGRGVTAAQKDMASLDKKGRGVNDALNKVGRTTGIAGAAVATGLGFAVKAAADFEQRLSAIKAVSGASQSQMDEVRKKALQLGKDTVFSAGESAQAMEELIKAGISIPDVMNGAADATVALAAAGEIDLPQAATIAANAMNQFGLAAKDLPNVADQIAGAANASAIDVGDFGQSLQQVGAVAHLAGVDFNDTATAIAIMGNAGIRGSDAGTSLKTMFQRLQPVTKKQREEMKSLGLITKDGSNQFYTAEGRTKSLAQVAGVLQKSLKGMSAQQKQAALQTLFGSDAIRGAAILSEAGSKGFDKMANSMNKVKAADVAKTRMDNLKGSIEQMKGSLETAGIAMGTVLLPGLRRVVDALTQVLNAFLNLSPGVQKFITISAAVIAAVLLVVAGIAKMIVFINETRVALVALRTAMAGTWLAALGPIALVVAAVAAVVVLIVLLWKHNETFRTRVTAAWNAVKGAIMAVWGVIKQIPGFFVQMWNDIKGAFSAGIDWVKQHWMLLMTIFGGPLGLVIALIIKFHSQIVNAFQAAINFVLRIWKGFWGSAFGGLIKASLDLVLAILQLWWVIVKGLFLLGVIAIRKVVQAGFQAIAAVVRAVMGVVRAAVSAGMHVVEAVVRAGVNAVRKVWGAVWGAIAAVARAIWSRIGGTVTSGVNRVRSAVSSAMNAVKNFFRDAWDTAVSKVREAVGKIGALVGSIKDKVTGAFAGAAKWLFDKGVQIIQGLLDGITSMISKVTDKIHSVTSAVGKFLPGSPVKEGPLKVLNRGHAGKQIVQMVIDGLTDMSRPLANAAADAFGDALPAGFANPGAGALPRPTRRSRGRGRGRLRMVHGALALDPSGKAFIRGVAEEADGDDDDFGDTVERMG